MIVSVEYQRWGNLPSRIHTTFDIWKVCKFASGIKNINWFFTHTPMCVSVTYPGLHPSTDLQYSTPTPLTHIHTHKKTMVTLLIYIYKFIYILLSTIFTSSLINVTLVLPSSDLVGEDVPSFSSKQCEIPVHLPLLKYFASPKAQALYINT